MNTYQSMNSEMSSVWQNPI